MFVQVMQGTCKDADGAHRLLDRWAQELAPGAVGWLGTTAGVTADDELFAAVRFASAEDARANSDRPQQGAWWSELSKHFDREVTVHDCPASELWMGGGSDGAGFVQVIQSQVRDRDKARSLMDSMRQLDPAQMGRDDVIGGTLAWHGDDDGVTQVVYFTSEADAREGEARASAEGPGDMSEWDAAFSPARYLDLTEPWLYSPE